MTFFGWELSRILKWLVIAAIVIFIFQDPTGAAAEVHKIFGVLDQAVHSLITFFNTATNS